MRLQESIEIPDAIKTRFGTTTFQVSMNSGSWDKLPADIQQVFLDNSGVDWWREVGDLWTAADDFGIGLAVKAGNTHTTLSAEETAAFRQVLEPVVDRWVKEVGEQGIDGDALVNKARELIAKHSGD